MKVYVYVNDIIIKLTITKGYLKSIDKVFVKFWRHNMKINSKNMLFV